MWVDLREFKIKLRLEIGQQLLRFSLGKVDILRSGLTCPSLKSTGNKPDHSDAFTNCVVLRNIIVLKTHVSIRIAITAKRCIELQLTNVHIHCKQTYI